MHVITMRNKTTFRPYWLKVSSCAIFIVIIYYLVIDNQGLSHFTAVSFCNFGIHSDYVEGANYVEENFNSLDQFDPELIRYVRVRYLTPPASRAIPYYFKIAEHKTEHSAYIRKLFKDKRDGVFIEAGANEGEVHSHTLDLEVELGWSGLLIECNPTVTPYLKTHRRKAWVAGVCISTDSHPATVNFSNPTNWSYSGTFGPAWDLPVAGSWTYFDVETVPLFTIIKSAGLKEIDFFSLDVEGIELKVLKYFPFDQIKINVLILEVHFLSDADKLELRKLLESNRMKLYESWQYDQVYVHQDFHAPD